jgi:AcrR family transcriptional regulator
MPRRLRAYPNPVDDAPPPRPTNRDRPNSRGDNTRLLILETAEHVFADRGIAAVPLRDVGLAAGQKNNVAVQYHFGDRETLIKAIISYRASTSEEIRSEVLADLLAQGKTPDVRDLVRAFILSLAKHLEEGNHYLAFLSRYIIEMGGYRGLEGSLSTSTVTTMISLLYRLLPDYPEAVLFERWMIMMTSTVHSLARYQTARQSRKLALPLDALLDDLVTFLAAGIESVPQLTTSDAASRD